MSMQKPSYKIVSEWAAQNSVHFVSRSHGQATTETMSKAQLERLVAYAISTVEAQGVPDALREEAMKLASILSGMVEGGYSDLETLYTEDQADGDAFVKRAAEVLDLLASAPPAPQVERCKVCNYQYGHQIGCENNPVDIALKARSDMRIFDAVEHYGGVKSDEELFPAQASRVQKWPVSQDPLTQLQVASIISERDAAPQASVVQQEPANVRGRWNIELDGDDLLVCFNDHDKVESCSYQRYVPAQQAKPQPLTHEQKWEMWTAATIEQPSARGCYFRGVEDAEAKHGIKA